jgi:hypothetical protein
LNPSLVRIRKRSVPNDATTCISATGQCSSSRFGSTTAHNSPIKSVPTSDCSAQLSLSMSLCRGAWPSMQKRRASSTPNPTQDQSRPNWPLSRHENVSKSHAFIHQTRPGATGRGVIKNISFDWLTTLRVVISPPTTPPQFLLQFPAWPRRGAKSTPIPTIIPFPSLRHSYRAWCIRINMPTAPRAPALSNPSNNTYTHFQHRYPTAVRETKHVEKKKENRKHGMG